MILIVFAVLLGLGVLALTFRPIFGSLAEFSECLRFWITPDIVSLFRGEYGRDWWGEAKLGLWLLTGALAGFGGYAGLVRLLAAT